MIVERIKKLRKILQLSQGEFGRQLGVSRDVITNLEYGRVQPKPVFLFAEDTAHCPSSEERLAIFVGLRHILDSK